MTRKACRGGRTGKQVSTGTAEDGMESNSPWTKCDWRIPRGKRRQGRRQAADDTGARDRGDGEEVRARSVDGYEEGMAK